MKSIWKVCLSHALHPIQIFCADKKVVRDLCTAPSSSKWLCGLFASDSQNYILFPKEDDCCSVTVTGSVCLQLVRFGQENYLVGLEKKKKKNIVVLVKITVLLVYLCKFSFSTYQIISRNQNLWDGKLRASLSDAVGMTLKDLVFIQMGLLTFWLTCSLTGDAFV